MFHFEDISAMVLDRGAGRQVYDVADLCRAIDVYLGQPIIRATAGQAGSQLVADNHGSLEQTLSLIAQALSRTKATSTRVDRADVMPKSRR
jgi:3-deoxy-D-manno-octulosonic-acid transferase